MHVFKSLKRFSIRFDRREFYDLPPAVQTRFEAYAAKMTGGEFYVWFQYLPEWFFFLKAEMQQRGIVVPDPEKQAAY